MDTMPMHPNAYMAWPTGVYTLNTTQRKNVSYIIPI